MSSETVTAKALAEALYRILDSAFAAVEVERAHKLLERYESQKGAPVAEPVTAAELAEALRRLSSDTSRLCCSPDTRVGASVEHAEELLSRYDAQQAEESNSEPECTGYAASWCPRCGDCTCCDSHEFTSTPNDKCQLHGLTSAHAEPQQTESSKPALSDRVIIWEAVNRYVVACGGDPSSGVYGNTSRQAAVSDIERSIDASKPALSEVEQLALKLLTEYTLWSDTGRCHHDLIELSEQLREAHRKRGAL